MTTKTNLKSSHQPNQVVGIRLPQNLIIALKKEAASRNIRLNELFLEIWDLYQKNGRKRK